MKLARVIERTYGWYELRVFECKPCGVTYTSGTATDDKRASND